MPSFSLKQALIQHDISFRLLEQALLKEEQGKKDLRILL